jgi:hypothetical protein
MVRFAMLCACVLLLSSCASVQDLSSGGVGCPSQEIQVSDHHSNFFTGVDTWTAQCNGKIFYCSSTRGGYGSVSCTESKT